MPIKRQIQNGDIFATNLPDGRHGAIRVIKTDGKKSFLIATTQYIEKELPELSNPLLTLILIKNFFAWKNEKALCIYHAKKQFTPQYIGNIPLSADEEKIKLWGGVGGFAFGGTWGDWVGLDVYRQWRWDNDRDAVIAESIQQAKEREKATAIQPKPGKMLKDNDFWALIEKLDWTSAGNDNKVIAPLVKAVAALSKGDLFKFEETLSYKLFLLDTKEHAKNIGESAYTDADNSFSVDSFLYSRCVVVANGREFFDKVLLEPSLMPKDMEFEALLSVARDAYSVKTGGDDLEYDPKCSYETFSNREGWRG